MTEPFPVTVRGVDSKGESFEERIQLDNISAGGLYMRLARELEERSRPLIILELPRPKAEEGRQSGRVALRALVLRTEPHPDGTCGTAVSITSHRFL